MIVMTDHSSLKWMMQSEVPKICRWSLFLQQFDIEFRSVKGAVNSTADWLSRNFAVDDIEDDEYMYVPIESFVVTKQHLYLPELPTTEQLIQEYKELSTEELNESVEGTEGLRYHVRSGKLLIPPAWRQHVMFWFHASRFGGHSGINRTIKRMLQWVWWKTLRQDVVNFVKGCLVCARFGVAPKRRVLQGVLQRPFPLELISLDFVGPWEWQGSMFSVLVAIDHFSRFVVCKATMRQTAKEVEDFMEQYWLPVFGTPTAILTDRGSCFTAEGFRRYVSGGLGANLIYTSPYYPQGNAINESSHRSLNKILKAAIVQSYKTLSGIVTDASLIQNALPCVATGASPFYCLFGFEPVFPGWQAWRTEVDEDVRVARQAEMRVRSLVQEVLDENQLKSGRKDCEFSVGDWIVFWLSDYESLVAHENSKMVQYAAKFSPTWSLPSKIVEVRSETLVVAELGARSATRQIPLRLVRKLKTRLPAVLSELNLRLLEVTTPRKLAYALARSKSTSEEMSIDNLIDEAFRTKQARPTVRGVIVKPCPIESGP